MPAILDRPQPVLAMALGPAQQLEIVPCPRSQRLGRQLTAVLVDHDDGVRVLVRVDPEGHRGACLLLVEGWHGPVGGHIPVGATPRSSQAMPAGPLRPGGRKTDNSHEGN